MAITFDAATLAQANATTTNTFSHTTSGSNRLLVVGVQFATGTDLSGTPTYAGVNMTQIGTYSIGGGVFDKCYLYYLIAPASGANNVVINNTGGANYIYAAASSYAGVAQTSPIDVSGSGTAIATSITKSVTTTVNNDWLVGYFSGGTLGSTFTAGSNTTLRTSGGASWNVISDSNASQTPAGAFSLAVNASGAEHLGACIAAIKPVAVATVNSGFFMAVAQ